MAADSLMSQCNSFDSELSEDRFASYCGADSGGKASLYDSDDSDCFYGSGVDVTKLQKDLGSWAVMNRISINALSLLLTLHEFNPGLPVDGRTILNSLCSNAVYSRVQRATTTT